MSVLTEIVVRGPRGCSEYLTGISRMSRECWLGFWRCSGYSAGVLGCLVCWDARDIQQRSHVVCLVCWDARGSSVRVSCVVFGVFGCYYFVGHGVHSGIEKIYECGTWLWKLKGEAQEEAKKEFIEILQVLEKELDDKKFFWGDTFGFVGIALVPFTAWFYSYETCANFSVAKEAPKLVAWGKRCLERESVTKTPSDPKKVYEFVGCA